VQFGLTDQKKKSGLRDSVPCVLDEEVTALGTLLSEYLARGRGTRGLSYACEQVASLLNKLRKREVGIGRLGQFGKQMGFMNVNLTVLGEGPWRVREDDEWYHVEIPGKVEGVFLLKDSEMALAQAAAYNAVLRTRWLDRKGEF
jgi:hypothetical protein